MADSISARRTQAILMYGWITACILSWGLATAANEPTPAELYGELFERVQIEAIYPDSKTFADAQGKYPPAKILADYRRERGRVGFDLPQFVAANFILPQPVASNYHTTPGQDVREHIDLLWKVLERGPDVEQQYSSRIALPFRYVVPGGRFNEIYYWDSYFTMLGLEESGRHDLTVAMVRNFAWLIDRYGHIPNGNRTYFLSRSQPPFFAAMIELLVQSEGTGAYRTYLPQLQKEYDFWMAGAAGLKPGAAQRRVVRLDDGTVLNRYWDDRPAPREEAWKEDLATAKAAGGESATVYRNLRAAAESGWDFSSRWFADGKTLPTIRTGDVLPVDLNSLLYGLELTLSRAYESTSDETNAKRMRDLATQRKAAMQRLFWNASTGAFIDYDWRHRHPIHFLSAATLYPLFFKLAEPAQAEAVALTVRQNLLGGNGIASTMFKTGQQWDAPNGWAPLQWIAIAGLRNYQQDTLAATIAQRWVAKNLAVFRSTGKLVEKYDVTADSAAAGGEYPLQDGFGWTNGVLRKLLAVYPALAQ
ncbi:MAG: alpha,alpha-trehalase TreF [Steroidobacteraceae bacterium]